MKVIWLSLLILLTTSMDVGQPEQPTLQDIMDHIWVMQKELDVCCSTEVMTASREVMDEDLRLVVRLRQGLVVLEDEVELLKMRLDELEDELKIEIEGFNKLVITENFNRTVCQQLVKQLDPEGDEKTAAEHDAAGRLMARGFHEELAALQQ